MTRTEKNKLLTTNSILWLAAMVLPVILHIAFASTRFPWHIVVPMLLIGPMLASNSMLSKATGIPTDDAGGS